jgi:ribosome-binding protein aMBF1 (putative translation factor)
VHFIATRQQKSVSANMLVKKTQKTPRREIETALRRAKEVRRRFEGGSMSRKFIPVEEAFREWRKDPEFLAAYEALEDEFAVASALIKARGDAAMTQEQVAQAMGTTQAVVARLESGKTMPSTRTLERFAKATHTRLRIRFEPEKPRRSAPR